MADNRDALPILLEDERDFEGYLAKSGARLAAGLACDRCRSVRLRGHGSYTRKGFVGEAGIALPIRRVRCVDCGRAPSLVPAFAATGLRTSDTLIEEAAARYVAAPITTYRSVAAWLGTAHSTVHRWLTRLGGLGLASLVGMLLRLRPDLDALALLPKLVPSEDRKARSPARADLLRRALGVLTLGRRIAEELVRGTDEAPPTAFALVRRRFAT